jgi:hypothetical protein
MTPEDILVTEWARDQFRKSGENAQGADARPVAMVPSAEYTQGWQDCLSMHIAPTPSTQAVGERERLSDKQIIEKASHWFDVGASGWGNVIAFALEILAADRSTAPTTGSAPVAEGWQLTETKNLDALIIAMEHAENKGYLPDAIKEAWGEFMCNPARVDAPASPAASTPVDRDKLAAETWVEPPSLAFEYAKEEVARQLASKEDAASPAANALTDAVRLTIETITRQLDLIAERAPGIYLDKIPVIRSLTAHKNRLEKALLAASMGGEPK